MLLQAFPTGGHHKLSPLLTPARPRAAAGRGLRRRPAQGALGVGPLEAAAHARQVQGGDAQLARLDGEYHASLGETDFIKVTN